LTVTKRREAGRKVSGSEGAMKRTINGVIMAMLICGLLAVGFPMYGETGASATFKVLGLVENESFLPGSVRISADFQHITYAVRVGERQQVVFDGKKLKVYDGVMIGTPTFIGDSNQLVYIVKKNGEKKGDETVGDKWFLVTGEKEHKKYDFVVPHSIIASPGNKRMVYIARTGDNWFLVEGTKEYPGGMGIEKSSVMFGPDGKRLVFVYRKDANYHVYKDGTSGPGFPWIDDKSISFSPDGNHLVYIAGDRNEQNVLLDHRKIGSFTNVLDKEPDDPRRVMGMRPGRMSARPERKEKFYFGPDGTLRFFGIQNQQMVRVEVKL